MLLNEERLGIFFARIDTLYNGEKELVIMFAVSEEKIEIPLTSVLNPVFDELAKVASIKTIRMHSQHRGIDKMLGKNGYNFSETIYIKRIN